DQVANRLRSAHKKATVVSIHIGYSRTEMKKSINAQKKLTQQIFQKQWLVMYLNYSERNTPLVQ
ncbi:TPA: hypothetical protein ACHI2E_001788, partial [Streptococcus pyogenes]